MKDLSIIIVCYRGWERLIKCLQSLDSFTGENFRTEVIIVDNRSEDDTIKKIEKQFLKFRFIHNRINGGFSYGCNTGARASTGKMLLFLNPDTVALEKEVEKLLNIAEANPSWSIISCRQVNEKGKENIVSGPFPGLLNITGLQRAIFRTRKPLTCCLYPDISFPDWVSGSVVLIRKELFQELNGFDEDYWMYFEDVDICKRVRDSEGEIALCRNITVEHNHGGSSRINLNTTSLSKTEVHISRHLFIEKHKTGFERFSIQLFLVINNILSCGLLALIGLLFFFVPELFCRTLIFTRLISYYFCSASSHSWVSPRSVKYKQRRFD